MVFIRFSVDLTVTRSCFMSLLEIISSLKKSLPSVFGRSAVRDLMPGIIAPGTLANLDSKHQGPPCYRARGKVIYEREAFLMWLEEWLHRRRWHSLHENFPLTLLFFVISPFPVVPGRDWGFCLEENICWLFLLLTLLCSVWLCQTALL